MRLSAIFLCLIVSSVSAQPLMPDLATDQELLVAYCLGTANQERANFGTMVDPKIEGAYLDEIKERIARFYFYLRARGFFSGGRSVQASLGIRTAWERGKDEENACRASRGKGTICKSVARCYDLYPPI